MRFPRKPRPPRTRGPARFDPNASDCSQRIRPVLSSRQTCEQNFSSGTGTCASEGVEFGLSPPDRHLPVVDAESARRGGRVGDPFVAAGKSETDRPAGAREVRAKFAGRATRTFDLNEAFWADDRPGDQRTPGRGAALRGVVDKREPPSILLNQQPRCRHYSPWQHNAVP